MSNNRILVTGANGQLGKSLASIAPRYPDFEFLFADRKLMSITDREAVAKVFREFKPGFCINAAAYTAVDKAETDIDGAMAVNNEAVANLAAIARSSGTGFVHVSTDYVFDGTSETPYKEDHPTDPVNQYGASKLAGEQSCLSANPDAIIIRTAWVYSEYGNNFVKTMLRLMKDRKEIGVVYDQVGAPTYAVDLAAAILDIIWKTGKTSLTWLPGMYHYSNLGKISWHEFAGSIQKQIGSECYVKAITTAEFPTAARRPAFSLLDTSKIRDTYQLEIPHWEKSLAICLGRIAEGQ